jgi:hypothetical protein
VPSYDLTVRVDQHRHVEAERLDAACYLADLLSAVLARVTEIEFQLGDSSPNYGGWSVLILEFSFASVCRPFRFHHVLPERAAPATGVTNRTRPSTKKIP